MVEAPLARDAPPGADHREDARLGGDVLGLGQSGPVALDLGLGLDGQLLVHGPARPLDLLAGLGDRALGGRLGPFEGRQADELGLRLLALVDERLDAAHGVEEAAARLVPGAVGGRSAAPRLELGEHPHRGVVVGGVVVPVAEPQGGAEGRAARQAPQARRHQAPGVHGRLGPGLLRLGQDRRGQAGEVVGPIPPLRGDRRALGQPGGDALPTGRRAVVRRGHHHLEAGQLGAQAGQLAREGVRPPLQWLADEGVPRPLQLGQPPRPGHDVARQHVAQELLLPGARGVEDAHEAALGGQVGQRVVDGELPAERGGALRLGRPAPQRQALDPHALLDGRAPARHVDADVGVQLAVGHEIAAERLAHVPGARPLADPVQVIEEEAVEELRAHGAGGPPGGDGHGADAHLGRAQGGPPPDSRGLVRRGQESAKGLAVEPGRLAVRAALPGGDPGNGLGLLLEGGVGLLEGVEGLVRVPALLQPPHRPQRRGQGGGSGDRAPVGADDDTGAGAAPQRALVGGLGVLAEGAAQDLVGVVDRVDAQVDDVAPRQPRAVAPHGVDGVPGQGLVRCPVDHLAGLRAPLAGDLLRAQELQKAPELEHPESPVLGLCNAHGRNPPPTRRTRCGFRWVVLSTSGRDPTRRV